MNPQSKLVVQLSDLALTSAGTAAGSGGTYYFDTLGYDFASIAIISQTTAGTYSTLNIMEADVTTSASFATFSGGVGGTDFTIGTSPAAGNYLAMLDVDLRGRKRFLKAVIIPSEAETVSVIANLFKGDTAPRTAAERGVSVVAAM